MLRVYVGNLPYRVRDAELKEYFEQQCGAGTVQEATVPLNGDRRSMGFGFVEFTNDEAYQKALSMSGTEMDGRPLRIDAARPKEDRSTRSEQSAEVSGEEAPTEIEGMSEETAAEDTDDSSSEEAADSDKGETAVDADSSDEKE